MKNFILGILFFSTTFTAGSRAFAITGDQVMLAVINEVLNEVKGGTIDAFYSVKARGIYLDTGSIDPNGDNSMSIVTDGSRVLQVKVDVTGRLVSFKEYTGGKSSPSGPDPDEGGLIFMKNLLQQSNAFVQNDPELIDLFENLGQFSFKSDYTTPRTADYLADLLGQGGMGNAVLVLFANKDGKIVKHAKGHLE